MSERPGSEQHGGAEFGAAEPGEPAPGEWEDQVLLARLARIVDQLDPVPALAYELGRAAFELGRVDAELVELVRDSVLETGALAGVRGAGGVRLLSFEAADLDVDLQVVPRGGRRSVLGQVAGAVADVRVETVAEGMLPTTVDRHGRFQVDDTPAGRIRLHVTAGGSAYVTSWVSI
jgi:hypothetical protein